MAAKRDVAAEARDHFARFSKFRQAYTRPSKLSSTKDGWLFWLQGAEMSLHGVDVNEPEMEPLNVLMAEKRTTKMSKEEELLAQRQRSTATAGVTSYKALSATTIFYCANGSLFLSQDGSSVNLFDHLDEGSTKPKGATMDFQHNPMNPYQVAFTSDNNLHVMDIDLSDSGDLLSVSLKTLTTIGQEEFPCAIADYIIQEEFERFTGYYWSPNGKSILYTVTDTSQARELSLVNSANEAEKMRFSKVGDPNAVSVMLVVDVANPAAPRSVVSQQLLWDAFCAEGSTAKGGPEYVPRLGWLTDDILYCQLLDRCQETTHCLAIGVKNLQSVAEERVVGADRTKFFTADAAAQKPNTTQLLWSSHRPDAWVDTCQAPIFLPALGKGPARHMLFLSRDSNSEAGGWQHLFLSQFKFSDTGDVDPAQKPSIEQLTKGKWNIEDGSVRCDSDGEVFFVANSESRPLQKGLYGFVGVDQFANTDDAVISLRSAPDCHVESYAPVKSRDCSISAAYLAHTDNNPPELCLSGGGRSDGNGNAKAPKLRDLKTGWFPLADQVDMLPKPQCLTFKNREGQNLNARLFLPKRDESEAQGPAAPLKKVPMMMYVYGGPHVQLINDGSFYCRCDALHNTLVELGVAVAVVDNRMAHSSNGQSTHKSCKLAMGSFETKDYVDAVEALSSRFPIIDAERVGIMGWSYGGYATLLAMAEASDVFKLGSSGAPVGDWRLYDTGYTERYMGLLTDPKAAEAYERSTIGAVASGFPLELDRLIIAHGLLDENVHFSHTCHVLDAMVKNMKPYRLLAYPQQRHGMGPDSRNHYNSLLCQAIVQYL